VHAKFVRKSEGRNLVGDKGIHGRIILRWIQGNKMWTIHLAEDTVLWQVLVNTVMNLQVP
jgi:hypothetical protein